MSSDYRGPAEGREGVMLYQIDLTYACFGIRVSANGTVLDAAPIAHWMIGKPFSVIEHWVARRRGSIAPVRGEGAEDQRKEKA